MTFLQYIFAKIATKEANKFKLLEYESSLTSFSTLENFDYFASPSTFTSNIPNWVTSPVQNLENSHAMTLTYIECPSARKKNFN